MKSQFLVQKARKGQRFILNCSVLADIVVSDTEDGCLNLLKKNVNDFLNANGKEYVNGFMSNYSDSCGQKINCPDGFVLLPLDAWYCKYDKSFCAMNGSINLIDKGNFLKHCRAVNKEGIFKAVEKKAYTGFHHLPGRYLCPYCDVLLKDSRQNFKYHYPWELYPLWECINFKDMEVIRLIYD